VLTITDEKPMIVCSTHRDIVASTGPVSIVIRVEDSFYNYRSGVYFEPKCGQTINHAMLLVGYGTDPAGGDYWIIKNSWGKLDLRLIRFC
jgi:C1A family cysteine protease